MNSSLICSIALLCTPMSVFGALGGVEVTNEAAIQSTAATPEGRHALAVAELKRVADDELDKLSRTDRRFVEGLLDSKDRLADFMLSGPCEDPAKGLRILASLWKADPQGLADRHEQTTAAAVALTFAMKNWPEDKAFDRYAYFRDSRKAGQLHPSFDSLETWEKRFVVSAGGNGGFNDVGGWGNDSLVWLRDNVKLPVSDYTGACWQAPYKSDSPFGDTIQGPNYYAPFSNIIHAKRVRDVGGVCGSLSHYGANAARANGIPAITMGEPGHCAYAVRVSRGNWQPAYTLSWQRGLHTSLWGRTWTQLVIQEAAFDNKAAYDRCLAHLWQARALKEKNPDLAEAAYAAALEAQPLNVPAWIESVDFLRDVRKPKPEAWAVIGRSIATKLSAYPESAWDVFSRILTPALAALADDAKLDFLMTYHTAIAKEDGPVMWQFDDALETQSKALGGDTARQLAFFEKVLAIQSASKSWFAPTIAWGQKKFSADPASSNAYFAVLGRVFSSVDPGSNEAGLRAALGPAILAAEAANNVEAFQALGRAGASLRKPNKVVVEPFPGDLLSSGGLMKPSTTSQWDHPENHWGVLEEDGGFFHTAAEVKPNVVVRLGKLGDVSGIVVLGTDYGYYGGRALPLKVSVSEDGTTWTEVFRTTDPKGPWRIPLEGKATRVQFVKAERDDERREVFHLAGVRVYGRRLQ